MENTYKPSGYNSVSPYLVIKGAQKMIDLLKKIFDAKELRRYDKPDGLIMHAEISIDDSVIMIGDATEEFKANQHLLHVYVPDVNDTFKKAIRAGCDSVEEPVQKEGDSDIRGMFRDFAGNVWAIGTQVS